LHPLPDSPDTRDELDNANVRQRLDALRRRAMQDSINAIVQEPLAAGQDGHNLTAIIDAFGRGPSSPFHMPDVRPSWAPTWQPRPAPELDAPDDDGIIWKVG
jgi:protein gp37